MKITLTKGQRERGQRIFNRVKKMCKAALFALFMNFIASSAVFEVVKEQITGSTIPEGYEQETAFIDQYGDLEEMIQQRRTLNRLSGKYIPMGARAQDETLFTFDPDRIKTLVSDDDVA